MKSKSAQKIKLASYDDLFGTDAQAGGEQVAFVPTSQLHAFKSHPFRVMDDEKMQETVDSVKEHGVLMPGIVRPRAEGGYEAIAGHRRWRACELAGLPEMPVLIRDLDDDAATVAMVDSNIQREDVLPSEKALAYKMKYDALRHQGSRGDKHTADMVGEAAGESGRTVQRYIRLAELCRDLLAYVDAGKIPMTVGERLSHLLPTEQAWLVEAIASSGIFPSRMQAEQLKADSGAGRLTEAMVHAAIMKKNTAGRSITFQGKRIRSYFPAGYTKEQIEEVVYSLLEKWNEDSGWEGKESGYTAI